MSTTRGTHLKMQRLRQSECAPRRVCHPRDGLVLKQLIDCAIPLVCIEYRRIFGEKGCNPLTEAIRELLVLGKFAAVAPSTSRLTRPSVQRHLRKNPLSIIHSSVWGAYLTVFGVIFTDKFIFQQLADIKWPEGLPPTNNIEPTTSHKSWRHCVSLLQHWEITAYDEMSKDPTITPLIDRRPHPRFFPYLTGFAEYDPEANAKPDWTGLSISVSPATTLQAPYSPLRSIHRIESYL